MFIVVFRKYLNKCILKFVGMIFLRMFFVDGNKLYILVVVFFFGVELLFLLLFISEFRGRSVLIIGFCCDVEMKCV